MQISSFGERVKYLLKKNDMSQQEFASLLGITTARLNNYLNDKTEAGYSLLAEIARFLGTTVDYLLGRNLNYNSVRHIHCPEVPPFRVFHCGDMGDHENLHYMLLPVYTSDSGEPVCFSKVTVSENIPFSGAYCVKVTDTSMVPVMNEGDFIYISPFARELAKEDELDSSAIYAVRLSSDDKIGVSLRYCLKSGNTLFLRPLDSTFETLSLDISKCGYNPIAGKMLGLSRVYRAD